jgi:flagellar biosynthetic protein FliR
MPQLSFSPEEVYSFFAVLVRYASMIAVFPILGDRFVPGPMKILLALSVTFVLYPALVIRGQVLPSEAVTWGATASGILGTIFLEALFGLALGFVAKLLFDAIQFGANLTGSFMGFSAASIYDPHQESQSQVIAEVQMAIAMLAFLALDGHHLMLRAALDSYRIVGLGKAGFSQFFGTRLIDLTSQTVRFGVQIAAPVAVTLFAVNIAFGVISRAMPQMNILVMSLSVSAVIGFIVLWLSIPEFQGVAVNILGRIEEWLQSIMFAIRDDGI